MHGNTGTDVCLALVGVGTKDIPCTQLAKCISADARLTGRISSVAVTIAPHLTVCIIAVYGFSGTGMEHLTEQLLERCFCTAETLGGPCVIAGDFNRKYCES